MNIDACLLKCLVVSPLDTYSVHCNSSDCTSEFDNDDVETLAFGVSSVISSIWTSGVPGALIRASTPDK